MTRDRLGVGLAAAVAIVATTTLLRAIPDDASSLPWRTSGNGPVIVHESTMYVAGTTPVFGFAGIGATPRANRGVGVALLSALDATGGPVPDIGRGIYRTSVDDGAGGWFIGGDFQSVDGQAQSGVIHVLADGRRDPAFRADIDAGVVYTLARQDSVLAIGGFFGTVNGTPRTGVALVQTEDGAVLPAAPAAASPVRSLAFNGATIVAGGAAVQVFDVATGAAVPGFTSTAGGVQAVAIGGGALFIGGTFTSIDLTPRLRLAKLDLATGALDPAWDAPVDAQVNALVVRGSSLYAGGGFIDVNGTFRGRVAALDVTTGALLPWRADTDNDVHAFAAVGDTLYLAGIFRALSGEIRPGAGAVSLTTGTATPWYPSIGPYAFSIAVGSGQVAVGGDFDGWGRRPEQGIMGFDLRTGDALRFAPRVDNDVRAMIVAGPGLVVGGSFTAVDALPRARLAAFDLTTHDVLPFAPVVDGPVDALATNGSVLYVGGTFTTVDGQPRPNLAAFDLATGTLLPWAPATNGPVHALVMSGSQVLAGGEFTTVRGTNGLVSRDLLAAIDAGGAVTPFAPAIPAGGIRQVLALAASNSTVYVGGVFAGAAVAFDVPTSARLPWSPLPDTTVHALSVHGGRVYLAGDFFFLNGTPHRGLAAVDAVTGVLAPWDPAVLNGRGIVATDAGVAASTLDGAGFFPELSLTGAPGSPAWPAVRITGHTLSITWQPPVSGPRATSYLLEAGTAPGQRDIGLIPVATTRFDVAGVPPGQYVVRLRAVNAAGSGGPSPELRFTVGASTCTAPPAPPVAPVVTTTADTVAMSWYPSPGPAPLAYTLHAAASAGGPPIASFPLGPNPFFSTNGVPPGAYFLRLSASNDCGTSIETRDVVVRVGGVAGPPAAPTSLTASAPAPGTVAISWTAPASGGPVTGYVLEAGSAPGLSDIAVIPLGPTTGLSAAGVPAGTYHLRVRAVGTAGLSAPTGDVTLIVP